MALCRLLLSNPDMLLLDEPTNHLDAESVGWLERFLTEYPGTVVAITHDRYFLDNAAQWILELDRVRGIPYEGNYSTWLEAKEKRLAQEARSEASRQRALKAELEWVRANPKGRQAKSKARLARFDELNSKEYQKRNETNEIFIPPGPRLGDVVINFDGVQKQFGDKVLFEDLSFIIPPGPLWASSVRTAPVKPPSSASITGDEQPDGGTVTVGETVQIANVGQMRDELDNSKTVWEEVSEGFDIIEVGGFEIPSRAYIGRFNFKGSDQQKRVGDLSGGERNRLQLAKLLKQGLERAHARRTDQRPGRETPGPGKTPCWSIPARCSSSATIAGSSIALLPTSSPTKGKARWCSSRAITRNMRQTIKSASSAPPGFRPGPSSAHQVQAPRLEAHYHPGGMTMTTVYGHCAPAFEGVKAAFQNNFDQNRDDGALRMHHDRRHPRRRSLGRHPDADHSLPEEDTVVNVYSTTKPWPPSPCCCWADRGVFALEDPVAKCWPEFAAEGKGDVTIAMLLAHRPACQV